MRLSAARAGKGVPSLPGREECLYDSAEIMGSLAATEERLDRAICSELPSQREDFALCGFGLGNGVYEQQHAARLIARGANVKLFGYDPNNACFDREWTPR